MIKITVTDRSTGQAVTIPFIRWLSISFSACPFPACGRAWCMKSCDGERWEKVQSTWVKGHPSALWALKLTSNKRQLHCCHTSEIWSFESYIFSWYKVWRASKQPSLFNLNWPTFVCIVLSISIIMTHCTWLCIQGPLAFQGAILKSWEWAWGWG